MADGIAQIQVHRWQDEFRSLSGIERFVSVTVDTSAQLVALVPQSATISETDSFRVVSSDIDPTFCKPESLLVDTLGTIQIVDIDPIPAVDDLYVVTDALSHRVSIYNARDCLLLSQNLDPDFNEPMDAYPYLEGNESYVLVAEVEEGNSRIQEFNRQSLRREWEFPLVESFATDAVALLDSQQVLICDSGNSRLIAVDPTKEGLDAIQWEYSTVEPFDPVDVEVIPSDPDLFLTTDQRNHRVVIIQRSTKQIIWQFGITGIPGDADSTLNVPSDADALPNGNILISDSGNNRLIEVNRQKLIEWRHPRPLFNLQDADRITSGPHANKTLVAYRDNLNSEAVVARRLGYQDGVFTSGPRDFGYPVDFDSLRWRAILPSGTNARLQLRTSQNLGDTTFAQWYGPTGTADFYVDDISVINSIHNGDRYYQFRAFLETNDPLLTPQLTGVEVTSSFYFPDSTGVLWSGPITDAAGSIITSWRTLEFSMGLPLFPGSSIVVDILDSLGSSVLASFQSGQQRDNLFDISPARLPVLAGRQALRLRATLQTASTSESPQLLSWALSWEAVELSASLLDFTDAVNTAVDKYWVGGATRDEAFLLLSDPNVQALRDSIPVQVSSTLTGDFEQIFMGIDPAGRQFFRIRPALPMVINQTPIRNNRFLEVLDRDTLKATYADPFDTTDTNSAAVLIIERVTGTMQLENAAGDVLESVSIGDQVFVRVMGETDHDLSITAQDTVSARLFNPSTDDLETLTLYEEQNFNGLFDTGNFRSAAGIILEAIGGQHNDGRLFVRNGDQIQASYADSLDFVVLFVNVAPLNTPQIIYIPDSSAALGQPLKVAAMLPNDQAIDSARVYFREGGAQSYDSAELMNLEGDTYEAEIPSGEVTIRGLEFYFSALVGETVVTFPPENPQSNPYKLRLRVQRYPSPLTLPALNYRMISVPLELDSTSIAGVLFDDYGEYNSSVWRLFRWQGEEYAEYPQLESEFKPGTAFWLNTVYGKPFEVQAAYTTSAVDSFRLTIRPGWNQVGNPFAFPVAWESVTHTGLLPPQAPVYYDGVEYLYDISTLMPWEGYFVWNPNASDVTLSIPPVAIEVDSTTRSFGKSFIDAGAFVIQFHAVVPGERLRDTQNFVGLHPEAMLGNDPLDFLEAPPIGEFVQVSIIDDGLRFARNFKPLNADGQDWLIEARSSLAAQALRITPESFGQLPAGLGIYILDLDFNSWLSSGEAFELDFDKDHVIRRFKIIIGTPEYAQQTSGDIPLVPYDFILSQNFPNPFSRNTTIQYQLGRRGHALIEVYNLIGQRVRTLINTTLNTGPHVMQWDGADERGVVLPNGVYVIRFRSGEFTAIRKTILVR